MPTLTRPARTIACATGLLIAAAPAVALSDQTDPAPSGPRLLAGPVAGAGDAALSLLTQGPALQLARAPRRTHRAHAGHPRRARLTRAGHAIAPPGAPRRVRQIIRAGNRIATTPYVWGGGHGGWKAAGYDCSGSVGFALHGAGLLDTPATSGTLASFGRPGKGRWVTVYANGGHVYMVVAGLRFDTSARKAGFTRWSRDARADGGYAVRHPAGL